MTSGATLLVELVTEELPPKALPRLGESFGGSIFTSLQTHSLVTQGSIFRWYATPRRLAVTVQDVLAQAPERNLTRKIMPVTVAFDAEGKPTAALLRKLASMRIEESEVARFERRMDGKTETLFYSHTAAGATLDKCLEGIVADSVAQLPIPKVMRWGSGDAVFVRPVHHLVMMHGSRVVAGRVLDLEAGNVTRGHRFMSGGEILIRNADEYEQRLITEGKVIPDFTERRLAIEHELKAQAERQRATLGDYRDLLDEVAALVEHPTVYVGEFDNEFLAVPQECLILTMRQNQKYFPLFDQSGKLTSRFLIVSNMKVEDPHHIIAGNERVVRPRLADARFFFDQDLKSKLEDRVERLAGVVYQNKLGTQLDRVRRIKRVAGEIARRLHSDVTAAERAAWLAKADLLTDMVGEFPELQGIMGRHYAQHDGEPSVVADAIETHYRPRFAGDALPQSNVACAVSLADKLDALVGFFGIGLVPTGEKDPFGLRRAALGVLRILGEAPLPLDLLDHVRVAAAGFPSGVLQPGFEDRLHEFILERLRNMLRDAGHSISAIEAVLVQKPSRIDLVLPRLEAVRAFVKLPEAAALAAANKRIVNILKKADSEADVADVALLQDEAEHALFDQLTTLAPSVRSSVANEDYEGALRALAGLRVAVDRFFDKVLVMAEEPLTRRNRLALLKQLAGLMNQVADISRLAVEK